MTIQELEQKLNECQKELAEIQKEITELNELQIELKESKKEGKWKPQNGDEYHYRKHWGGFDYYIWGDTDTDNYMYNNLPIFPTKEECERYWHFMDIVKEKSYEFSKEEWDDESLYKYHIRYQYYDKKIEVDSYTRTKIVGTTYFKTPEDAQYIIDNFKDELMEYFL